MPSRTRPVRPARAGHWSDAALTRSAITVEHELLHQIPRLAAAIVHAEPGPAAAAHEDIAHHR